MEEYDKIRSFRLSDKVYEEVKKLKKKGQSWDFLFEYFVECYYKQKELKKLIAQTGGKNQGKV